MTEELKSQADYFKDEPIYLRKVIEELKQENERLLKARNHFLAEDIKYYNALEEIRDKAGKILIEENKGDYWNLYEILSEILEKCLGVLDVKY